MVALGDIRRPEFGNPEHIHAIKVAAACQDFEALPKCEQCDGDGECSKCSQTCEDCGGSGKSRKAMDVWQEQNPGIRWWELKR